MVPVSVAVEFTGVAARLIVVGVPLVSVIAPGPVLAYPMNVFGAPEGLRVSCSACRNPAFVVSPDRHWIDALYVPSLLSVGDDTKPESPVHAKTIGSAFVPGPVLVPLTA